MPSDRLSLSATAEKDVRGEPPGALPESDLVRAVVVGGGLLPLMSVSCASDDHSTMALSCA